MTNTFGAANGNWSDPTKWSLGTVPVASDDAVLDALSGNCTIDVTPVCRSIDASAYPAGKTLLHNAVTLVIGDGSAGAGNKALDFSGGFTYTLVNVKTSAISFQSSYTATPQTINFAGKTSGDVIIGATAVSGNYKYTGIHLQGATAVLTWVKGILDTNSVSTTWGILSSNNSNVRNLSLGASAINIIGSNTTVMDIGSSNLTVNANTSTITCSGSTATIFLGNVLITTWNNIIMNGASQAQLNSAISCANFSRIGTAVKTDSIRIIGAVTCSGTLTLKGNSAINRLLVVSTSANSQRTLTAGAVVTEYTDFQDMIGAGAADWDLTHQAVDSSGDCYGNSGITFTTPTTQTYTGNTGSQSDVTKWTSRIPLPQDDMSFASCSGGTVTADMPRLGKNISWTGATGTPTWSMGTGVSIFGSLALINAMNTVALSGGISFVGRGSFTINLAGKSLGSNNFIINCVTGTYTLTGDVVTTFGNINTNSGTFVTAGYMVEGYGHTIGGAALLDGRNSIFRIKATSGQVWGNSSVTPCLMSGSTIYIYSASASEREFSGFNRTYGILDYTVTASSGALRISGSNTFDTIRFYDNG